MDAIAQIAPTPDWVAIVAPLGVGGVLAWFLWHTSSHTIPTLIKDNQEAIKEIVKSNDTATAQAAKSFTDSLREERQERQSERKEDRAALQKLAESFRCRGEP